MIYINIENFVPNADWLAKATRHRTAMLALATVQEKKDYITNIWSEIKQELLNLPNANKCWFSESIENVSDYHVEHFRPKKEVEKSKISIQNITFSELSRNDWADTISTSDGYWWLAFDHSNYRIAGSKINSSFKRNFFPIKSDSTFIAYSENDDYSIEEHILLDPTKKGDPDLITFEADGKAISTYYYTNDLWKYTRAEASIIIYGLNDIQDLKNARLTKWQKCNDFISEAHRNYLLHDQMLANGINENNNNEVSMFIGLEQTLNFLYSQIKNEIHPTSAFSAVALTCVKSYDYPWIIPNILT
ncbi:MAG TPA: hypothetical protein VNB90_12135 [Cytophagaceae bacterium]|jgi:hypothetical protein|nr:hypothetical protein [Cytophagaceae bacterium]